MLKILGIFLYERSIHAGFICIKIGWKFIHIDIRDTYSYLDSFALFQVFAHSNPLLNSDSYLYLYS